MKFKNKNRIIRQMKNKKHLFFYVKNNLREWRMKMEALKRIVIKEELVVLTGDYRKAIILNQFLYWTERVKDFDKFIIEEKLRFEKDGEKSNYQLQKGWIYKTSEELSEETMLGLSKSNIRLHIKSLIERGWIDERVNPNFKWDKTMQYRVNMLKLQEDLYKLGYALEGYPLFFYERIENSEQDENEIEAEEHDSALNGDNDNNENIEHRSSKIEPREFQQKTDIDEIELRSSKIEPRGFKTELRSSKIEQQYQRLLTENNNIYIYSQSVNNKKYQNSNSDDRDGPTEQDAIDQVKSKVKTMGYPCLEEEMIINSLVNIIRTKGTKFMDKLIDKKVIDFAINKFKKLDKAKIKNHQAYFTSVLNNSVYEYAASEVVGKEQSTDATKGPKNKFHNFTQSMINYSEQELEDIVRKKYDKKIQELKANRKIKTDKEERKEE